MEYKIITESIYVYTCNTCGHSFNSKEKLSITTVYCQGCRKKSTFNESIQENEIIHQYCPICNDYFPMMQHLSDKFSDEKVEWLANMVRHYRREHIPCWKKLWDEDGDHYRRNFRWQKYDYLKSMYNNRAKRQILRKCRSEMMADGFSVEDVLQLKDTDLETLLFYRKMLGNRTKAA